MKSILSISCLACLVSIGQLNAQSAEKPAQSASSSTNQIISSEGAALESGAASDVCLASGNIEMTNLVNNLSTDVTNCYAGDSIEICFQVDWYQSSNNNWLQAIVPTFDECFYVERDLATREPLRYTVPPPASLNGSWQWFPDLSVLYNDIPNGSLPPDEPVGEGWFFVGEIPTGAPCFDPADPNCTWGDQLAGTTGATFEICIIADIICTQPSPNPEPCNVEFKTYSDGEVGGYQFPGCQLDTPIEDLLFFACCDDPKITNDTLNFEVCSGESANITLYSDMDPETTFEWIASPEAFGASSGSGPVIDDVYFNDTGSPVTITYTVIPTCGGGCVGREKVFMVTVWPEILPSIVGDNVICEGDCAFLLAQTQSDQAPFTYQWNTGATTEEIIACEPAGFYFYSVTITDRNGCEDETIFWLEVLPTPQAQIEILGPVVLCPGESTQLVASAFGGSGNYTFIWDDGSNGSTLVVDQPGTYTVTAIDAFGCPSFPVSVVIEGAEIVLDVFSAGPDILCSLGGGHTADLSAIASGGSGSYTYQWSNGGGTESITVDEPGTYSIMVTDNVSGCVVSGQIDLEGADPPALFIDASPGNEICATDFSDGITLQASTAGGSGNFSYSWTDGTDGASTFAQSTGSLGLTVVDEQSGCVVTASPVDFIVHPPINIDIIPDSGTELCASGPGDGLTFTGLVSGGSGDFAYSWSNGDFDVSAFMPSSGSLALTVIDNQSGCTAEAQPVEVIIHEPINVEFFIDNGPEICAASADDGINLSATPAGGSGDYQFNWGNGEEGPTTLVQSTGSVGLTVIDQQTGCSTDVQSPLLTIHPPLDISILADAPTALCENSDQWPIELAVSSGSGSGSFSYSWSTGSSESSISVDDGGDYTLQLIDLVTGCEGSTALTITSLALPEISLTGPATACLSEQVCLDVQPLGGSWSNPNIIGNCLDLSTSNEGVQMVDYTYTDANGCTSSAAYQLEAFAPPALPQVNCTSTTASVIFDWPETDGYTYQVNGEPWNGGPYQVDGLVPEQEVTISLAVSTEGPCTPVTQTYQCATEACPPISVELTTDLSQAFCANDLPGQPIQLGIEIIGDDSQLGNGSWSGPGLIDINQGIIDLAQANLGVGEHTYEFTYQWSNCSYSTTQSLRIAAPPIVDAGEDQIVGCDFEQLNLLGEASSLSQIVWLDASGQQIGSAINQPITETGLYQIRATDPETNCFALDQVLVSEIEDRPEDVEITINPETCYGDGDSRIEVLQVFGGTAPYVYELDNEPQGFEGRWTGLEPAVYSLRIVDDMGCELWTEIDLPGRRPLLIELEEEVELIAGEEHAISLELPQDEQVVANWYPEIGIECMDASCLDVMLSPYFSQVYTVEVINDRGCMAVDEVSIIVKDGNAVYLPNAFSPNEDGQNDEFMIYPLQEEVRVSQRSIYDRWGNLVSGGSSSAQADQHYIWDGRHAGQMCNVGVYIYQVELTMPDGDKEVVTGEITLVR